MLTSLKSESFKLLLWQDIAFDILFYIELQEYIKRKTIILKQDFVNLRDKNLIILSLLLTR